jgi:hypothetical protein
LKSCSNSWRLLKKSKRWRLKERLKESLKLRNHQGLISLNDLEDRIRKIRMTQWHQQTVMLIRTRGNQRSQLKLMSLNSSTTCCKCSNTIKCSSIKHNNQDSYYNKFNNFNHRYQQWAWCMDCLHTLHTQFHNTHHSLRHNIKT